MRVGLCLCVFFIINIFSPCFPSHSDIYFLVFLDIIEDMKEECQKYGTVVSLLIPKENPGKGQVSKMEFQYQYISYFRINFNMNFHLIISLYRKCSLFERLTRLKSNDTLQFR